MAKGICKCIEQSMHMRTKERTKMMESIGRKLYIVVVRDDFLR